MVRHVNSHKNIIKKIMSDDYNRLSKEGARSLSLDKKNKSNTNTYNLNLTSNSNIIITKTRVTNLELVNRTRVRFLSIRVHVTTFNYITTFNLYRL